MRSVDSSEEASTIFALRRADASLSIAPDVEAFSARLALEPAPVPSILGTSVSARAKAGRWWLRRVLAGTTLVATLSGSAVAMAQGATPGSSLYGIKRASESLWLATSIGPQDRASRLLGLAERRAREVIAAERAGHHLLALQAAREARHDIRAAQELATSFSPKERGQVDERAGNEEQRLATFLAKDEAQSHDQHNGDNGKSDGPGTPSGGAGPSGASSDQQGTATTPPSGVTGPSGASPDQQGTATTPPSGVTGPSGASPDQQGTATTPPSGVTGPSGASPDQQGTATTPSG
jgi:hypothetical protein